MTKKGAASKQDKRLKRPKKSEPKPFRYVPGKGWHSDE